MGCNNLTISDKKSDFPGEVYQMYINFLLEKVFVLTHNNQNPNQAIFLDHMWISNGSGRTDVFGCCFLISPLGAVDSEKEKQRLSQKLLCKCELHRK